MSRTFCAVIRDERADLVLAPYGETMADARHDAFKQIHVLHRDVAVVKKEIQRAHGLTGRQFNGVRFDLDQAVNGWDGTIKFRVQNLKDAIEATEERIASFGRQMEKAKTEKRRASLKFKQVGKKQRLDVLRGELKVAEGELLLGRPRICFGGRELLREGRLWEWHDRRNGRIFLVGAKNEGPHGNQSVHWDGSSLRLRMPNSLGGKFETLKGVEFRYGQAELEAVLKRNENKRTRVSLTWLIFRADDGLWHAHVTVSEPVPDLVTDVRHGVVAVDLNVDHLAVVLIDYWGNPVGRLKLAFPVAGTPDGEAAVMIGDAVRALCLLARSRFYGIAVEDLDFAKKKAGLREYGAAHARRLSGFAYAKFFEVLAARCGRDGIDLAKVNPAYTSVIGKNKYARARAMSAHHAAALVIGRRAMGYNESFVAMDGAILTGPARNRPRTEWRRWRGVRRRPREGAQVPEDLNTAGSGVRAARKGGRKRPATATAGGARGLASASGRRTRSVPPQVGGAVAPAAERST